MCSMIDDSKEACESGTHKGMEMLLRELCLASNFSMIIDDVIKWKHYPRYWPFVQRIHRPPVNSPHKGQWHGALVFSFICAWINAWVNNREAGDLRHQPAHYDVIVMDCRGQDYVTTYYLSQEWCCIYPLVHQLVGQSFLQSIFCPTFLPEASFGLRVLSLAASVCLCVR